MKIKFDIASIGAAVTFLLSLLTVSLFAAGYNASNGWFAEQFIGLPYVVGFGVVAMILSAAVVVLPMLKVEGLAQKILNIVVDVAVVLTCVFLILAAVYAARSSVYEMALTWASELHINEPYMNGACTNALVSIILGVVGMVVMGVTACFSKVVIAKKEA